MSLRAFREWKAGEVQTENDSMSTEVKPSQVRDEDSESDVSLIATPPQQGSVGWGSKRLRSRKREPTDKMEKPSSAEDVEFIQGRCYKVAFKIDNSRPQEQIYHEEDFLDDEISGDEEWDGVDVVDDGYAW